jgi:hypothetical protein
VFVEITHGSGEVTRVRVSPSAVLTVGWVEQVWQQESQMQGEIQRSEAFALTDVTGLALVGDDKPARPRAVKAAA